MDTVRLRLQLDDLEIGYEGGLPLYEQTIEPLLDAACRSAPRAPTLETETPHSKDGPVSNEGRHTPSAPEPESRAAQVLKAPSATEPTSVSAGAVDPQESTRLPAEPLFQPASPDRFRQYVAQVGESAATDEQRIMAFGFYLWNYEKRNAFEADDVRGFLSTVHLSVPDNLQGLLVALRDRKRFLESDDGVAFRLSTKGVNYVKNRLLA